MFLPRIALSSFNHSFWVCSIPMIKALRIIMAALVFISSFSGLAAAQSGSAPVVIRDTEIESVLKAWSAPLVAAAGLAPGSVDIIIVQNDQLNAFVAGGANVFLYTGLIEKTENPGELLGVIAHELGHIRGGHLIRSRQAMENASYEAMLGMVLGVGAAILTGDGGAAAAVGMAGRSQAERRFMAFSRVQESSADQSALTEMNQARMNPEGLLTFMQKLESQELMPVSQQSEYVRTHPLTRDRVDAIRTGVTQSAYAKTAMPAEWDEQHKRILAKLIGFSAADRVPWVYDDRDQSIAARYARTIAAYRQNRVEEALGMMDALLKDEPKNPYFHELKGQMLMDFGRLGPAKIALRRAVELKPDAALIRIMLAHALIEDSGNGRAKADIDEAINHLNRAQRDEQRSSRIHRLLATAYGYQGQEAEARLQLAEEAVLQRRYDEAKGLAESASGQLKEGSRSWLRAQDILAYIQQARKNTDDDDSSE